MNGSTITGHPPARRADEDEEEEVVQNEEVEEEDEVEGTHASALQAEGSIPRQRRPLADHVAKDGPEEDPGADQPPDHRHPSPPSPPPPPPPPPTTGSRTLFSSGGVSAAAVPALDPANAAGGRTSLSDISLRAFVLGQAFMAGVLITIGLLLLPAPFSSPSSSSSSSSSSSWLGWWWWWWRAADAHPYQPLWRLSFFLAALSLFHFLEYWTTARYNPRYASVSAFLLTSNGSAYNIAQLSAVVECVVAHLLLPAVWRRLRQPQPPPPSPSSSSSSWSSMLLVGLGLGLTALGQATRSAAMIQAGANFNHQVQTRRQHAHQLVTTGVYAYLRHPSYFGFFWWALGAQMVLGNRLCAVVYAVVLCRFFRARIRKEEEFLVRFFGDAYLHYRARTWLGIPFC
ncbi:MAG: hypothetical protein M1826_005074 [Phylliscum demangeonii]|nr:MAG: hypothetical protein M1826_005074 [Phylliscum demangeonii]